MRSTTPPPNTQSKQKIRLRRQNEIGLHTSMKGWKYERNLSIDWQAEIPADKKKIQAGRKNNDLWQIRNPWGHCCLILKKSSHPVKRCQNIGRERCWVKDWKESIRRSFVARSDGVTLWQWCACVNVSTKGKMFRDKVEERKNGPWRRDK